MPSSHLEEEKEGAHLDIVLLRDSEAVVDGRRRRSPVFVQLQPDRASLDDVSKALRLRCVALTRSSMLLVKQLP